MAQRQFKGDDTSTWVDRYGTGSDGALTISGNTTFSAANASCSGTSGATSLTLGAASSFSNGDLVLIHQTRGTGAGSWELNKISSGGGSTSLTLTYALTNTYTDSGASQAQIVELKQYSSITVDSTFTWSAPEWDGDTGGILAFVCNGATTVNGTISATGRGFLGATAVSGTNNAKQGEGVSAARDTVSNSANGNGGGGGNGDAGNNWCGGGAGGANGAAGSNGGSGSSPAATVGTGGGAVGTANLVTADFGGAGGGGGSGASGATGGTGGDGGGFILIISKLFDSSSGSVVSNGNTGGNASAGGTQAAGGGGGAGGSILIKGQKITLGSSITASAGSGGSQASTQSPTFVAGNGGAGSVGRIHVDYGASVSGSTSPTLDSSYDAILSEGGSFLLNFI